jgi:hypothetical protein
MRHLFRTFCDSQDGQAVVELALAIPVLLIVVLGIADFGRAVNYWNDENHVANLGARYAAVGSWPSTCVRKENPTEEVSTTTLVAYIKCQAYRDSPELEEGVKPAGSSGVQGGITVCVSAPKSEVGAPVTVKVTGKYKWLPYPKVLGGGSTFAETTLTGTATMRLEQVPTANVTAGSSC